MKCIIDKYEWWPVFSISKHYDSNDYGIKDIPDDFFEKYQTTLKEWEEIQRKLRTIYNSN
jgi:hypothetical protein